MKMPSVTMQKAADEQVMLSAMTAIPDFSTVISAKLVEKAKAYMQQQIEAVHQLHNPILMHDCFSDSLKIKNISVWPSPVKIASRLTVANVLNDMAAFYEADHSRWTQQTNARDRYRQSVDPEDEAAHSFCIGGLIGHRFNRAPESDREVYQHALDTLQNTVQDHIVRFNDTPGRRVEEVIGALRHAARNAERNAQPQYTRYES